MARSDGPSYDEDGGYWLDEEDSDSEEERYPELVESWPGWGTYRESEAGLAARAQLDHTAVRSEAPLLVISCFTISVRGGRGTTLATIIKS